MVNPALRWKRHQKALREQKHLFNRDKNVDVNLEIEKLNKEIQSCKNCDLCDLFFNRIESGENMGKLTINHENSTMFKPTILFIGLAPSFRRFDKERRAMKGVDETATLDNFNTTGDLFRLCLKKVGLLDYDIWMTNILKCSTDNNDIPETEQVNSCKIFLKRELELLQPQKVVFLGSKVESVLKNDVAGIKIWHPSYIFRYPNKLNKYLSQLERLK
jgi:DNA polymerase